MGVGEGGVAVEYLISCERAGRKRFLSGPLPGLRPSVIDVILENSYRSGQPAGTRTLIGNARRREKEVGLDFRYHDHLLFPIACIDHVSLIVIIAKLHAAVFLFQYQHGCSLI